ncbi:hypothetical protein EON80_05590 [bacterium]|nr:MAG: hypothetical protein EON80_05590 [bacterium]
MDFQSISRRFALTFFSISMAALGQQQAQAQSMYGPGGLFLNPTADFPKQGQVTPAVLVMPQRLDNGNRLTWSSYSVDYGLTDKWELGATYLKINPGSSEFKDASGGLYAKYKVLEEVPQKRPALAVGGNFLSGGDANARTAFAALRFTPTRAGAKRPVGLHLGAIYIDQLEGIKHRELSPFAGIDYTISSRLSAFAEVRSALEPESGGTNGTFASRSLGVVWKPVNNFKLVLAYGSNGWNDKSSQLGFGIGYALRGGRTRGK